jgi:hypothetical protein
VLVVVAHYGLCPKNTLQFLSLRTGKTDAIATIIVQISGPPHCDRVLLLYFADDFGLRNQPDAILLWELVRQRGFHHR